MYIELDEGYPGHRKTLRLCALLKCDTADSYPPRLWAWAARSAPDGDLTGMDPSEVELALRYRGKDGALFAALVGAGFIDRDESGKTSIHNWKRRTGGAITRMGDRAYRVRERRAHNAGRCLELCSVCAGNMLESDPAQSPARINPVQSSPVQSSPVQSSGESGARAPARSNEGAKIWSAWDWRESFGSAWTAQYGGLRYGDAGDVGAVPKLGDLLERLSETERLDAQAKAPEMFAEFFANDEPRVRARRHPFTFFVTEWGGLRAPQKARSARRGPVAAPGADDPPFRKGAVPL